MKTFGEAVQEETVILNILYRVKEPIESIYSVLRVFKIMIISGALRNPPFSPRSNSELP